MRKAIGWMALFALMSCVTTTAKQDAANNSKGRYVADGIILPNEMCARHGVQAASKDEPGERMLCEFQEVLGSHIQRCVCWDEREIDKNRILTQQAVVDSEIGKCASGSGVCGR